MQMSVAVLAQGLVRLDMPVRFDQPHAPECRYAMFFGKPRTDDSVEVIFVRGAFHNEACEEYAWLLFYWSNFPRTIDGIVASFQLPNLQHVGKFAKPDPGKTFVLFEDRYTYELIQTHLLWLDGCYPTPLVCVNAMSAWRRQQPAAAAEEVDPRTTHRYK